ncbi:MAG: electron transfer flavoprotein-ubiquinone oxidoreductase, partial [Alphaproteobacteria bacterium]|nr:electron transfer flavoprotein-ubiquinone oxidoreductase [Alphaproteobacteria bacterium]
GALLETRALDELLPSWREDGAPVTRTVAQEKFLFLTKSGGISWPTLLLPGAMKNHGNYIVRLGNFVHWLGEQAEALGVEIYPGFAATEIVTHEDGSVKGVATGDMGVTANGEHGPNYQPGMELHGTYTFFAEGARGHLGKELMTRFDLRRGVEDQTFGLGFKELWEVDTALHRPGLVVHTAGWPLGSATYGGSFLYHLDDNLVAIGFVVALDYRNPYLSPYQEFQRFKAHPRIRPLLEGGRRISYGARALNEGGIQCLPKLAFPGGVLVGCEAGTLNVPKLKGTHTAMKGGMLAAEAAVAALADEDGAPKELSAYEAAFAQSWVHEELYRARNFRPAFKWGLGLGTVMAGFDQMIGRGRLPWTLAHGHKDHESLTPKSKAKSIDYPKPDGEITFDRLTNLAFSNVAHEEDQPNHLTLKDSQIPIAVNLATYDAPEQLYCPAGVYEILREADGSNPRLQINAQNCIHCKTCDIKDPTGNINWVAPEGGGGPNYSGM